MFGDTPPARNKVSGLCLVILSFYPTALKGVGRRQEKVCPGCISETIRCRKMILATDIG